MFGELRADPRIVPGFRELAIPEIEQDPWAFCRARRMRTSWSPRSRGSLTPRSLVRRASSTSTWRRWSRAACGLVVAGIPIRSNRSRAAVLLPEDSACDVRWAPTATEPTVNVTARLGKLCAPAAPVTAHRRRCEHHSHHGLHPGSPRSPSSRRPPVSPSREITMHPPSFAQVCCGIRLTAREDHGTNQEFVRSHRRNAI